MNTTGIRTTSPNIIPARRADFDISRHFAASGVTVPHSDADYLRCLDVGSEELDRAAILRLVSAALHPNEAFSVRAIQVLVKVPASILEVFRGDLRALFDALVDRRDPVGVLLTPAIEAFLDGVPVPRLLQTKSSVWTDDVQQFIAADGALEDPAYPRLIEILERFPSLHDQAMERLRRGVAPSSEAAKHIANSYTPALLPLIHNESQEARDAVQTAVLARMAEIALPTEIGQLPRWSTERAISENLGEVDAALVRLVIEENRLELIPAALASRAAKLLRDLAGRAELTKIDPTIEGHQLILMAAARSGSGEITPRILRKLTSIIVWHVYPPLVLAALMHHDRVNDELLEEMLRQIIEKSRRTITQARTLSDACFPHERSAFRRVMVEGYRRTIGSPHLVEAVFMATPPEALQEALHFLIANHALSLPSLVRRWIDKYPEAEGRVIVQASTLDSLSRDRAKGMADAASMLRRFAVP